jgi:SAM-dependent methyltransferase
MSVYDDLAPRYDKRYSSEAYLRENEIIFDFLRPRIHGFLLDIGCGTGLLLDYIKHDPELYIGIDPSFSMRIEMVRKHPEYMAVPLAFEELSLGTEQTFDTAVALFGSPSYISQSFYPRLKTVAPNYFYMFYREGYLPDYYGPDDKVGIDYKRLTGIFGPLYPFDDFVIASNMEGLYENL